MDHRMDHRWGNRTTVDLPVRISCCGTTVAGRVRNISISGAYVETPMRLPALTVVNLRVGDAAGSSLPPASVWGYVVRHDARGIAIEWCEEAQLLASG